MSLFLLPENISSHIDRLAMRFWWNPKENCSNFYHHISWSTICSSKTLEGLGLRQAKDFNMALILKLAWQFLTNRNRLWVKFMNAKYLKDLPLQWASAKCTHSIIWRSILKSRDIFFLKAHKTLANGENTNIWFDSWIPDLEDFRPPDQSSTFLTSVHQLINSKTSLWDPNVINYYFDTSIAAAIMKVQIFNSQRHDGWKWTLNNIGNFTVKSAYHLCRSLTHLQTASPRINLQF